MTVLGFLNRNPGTKVTTLPSSNEYISKLLTKVLVEGSSAQTRRAHRVTLLVIKEETDIALCARFATTTPAAASTVDTTCSNRSSELSIMPTKPCVASPNYNNTAVAQTMRVLK